MEKANVLDEYMTLLRQVGVNLSRARVDRGISQRELGKSGNKNPSMVAKVEKFAPPDISMRNIYEVARLIPVSLGEIISKAERDLELFRLPRETKTVGKRLSLLMEKLSELTPDEQVWISDMLEGLLARTSAPTRPAEVEKLPEAIGAQ